MTPRFITMKSPKDANSQTTGFAGGMPEDLQARESVISDLREEVDQYAAHEAEEHGPEQDGKRDGSGR